MIRRAWPRRWPDAERLPQPFRDVQEAFALWAHYVRLGMEGTAALPPERLLVLRYEDVLARPDRAAQNVLAFLEIPQESSRLRPWMDAVDVGRRFAFEATSEAKALLETFGDHPVMCHFGYTPAAPASGEIAGRSR